MNAPSLGMAEYLVVEPAWLEGDAIPPTLGALLRLVAEDYLNEIAAQVGGSKGRD